MRRKMPEWFGKRRLYNEYFRSNGCEAILWEVLPIQKSQRLIVRFISTNSANRQGIRIAIDVGNGNLTLNGTCAREFELWEDECPREFEMECCSDEGYLSAYNIFEELNWTGERCRYSQMSYSGMILEQNGNIYRYKCNNAELKDDFDKLIFEIELVQ